MNFELSVSSDIQRYMIREDLTNMKEKLAEMHVGSPEWDQLAEEIADLEDKLTDHDELEVYLTDKMRRLGVQKGECDE